MKYCVLFLFVFASAVWAGSAKHVEDSLIIPPDFTLQAMKQKHGLALISTARNTEWLDPHGIVLVLMVDDGNAIDRAHVAAQLDGAVRQTRENYPKEIVDLGRFFTVNRKDWVVIRSRNEKTPREIHRIIILGEMDGIYTQIQLIGPKSEADRLGRYLKFILYRNSGASLEPDGQSGR